MEANHAMKAPLLPPRSAATAAWIVTLLERRQIVRKTGVWRTWFGCGPVALLPT